MSSVRQGIQWTGRERECELVEEKAVRRSGGREPSEQEEQGKKEKQGPVEEKQQKGAKKAESQVDSGVEEKKSKESVEKKAEGGRTKQMVEACDKSSLKLIFFFYILTLLFVFQCLDYFLNSLCLVLLCFCLI